MMDEISISVSMPLDSDGFLRRECPSCEQEFKWFAHEDGDDDAESVEQYFCPLCGSASDLDSWWTTAQLEYAEGSAGSSIDQAVQDLMEESFKGVKGISSKPSRNFSLEIPTPEPLAEPDDMEIVQPPCHPNEPIKVPEIAMSRVYCLICGEQFAV